MEERVFTIDLRKRCLTTARWRKSHKSSFVIREYLSKHMKADKIKIGDSINKEIWSRGNQKPPSKIKVKAIKTKDDDGNDLVKAEMWGHVFEEEIKEEPKEKKSKETKTEEKPKEKEVKQKPKKSSNK